ncbi:TetR/AcrR family transcriptional regulator [Weissella kandleri]|uniref:TetR/AcrR family transcriptional regulator n=1 Tax=Weissella kandleri TaxID=1616 RepID=UPI00387EBC83
MAKISDEQIFAATHDLIVEKGLTGVRLTDIARQLEVTHAALYKHFKNRDALYEAMYTQWLDQVDAPSLTITRLPAEQRVDGLHEWLQNFVVQRQQAFMTNPEMASLYQIALQQETELINPRIAQLAETVETLMAWDTFRHQRGMLIMMAFTYLYHPFFVDRWNDNLYMPLFESTWLELLPVIEETN